MAARRPTAEDLAARIAAGIAAGDHAVGALLPGERPLCQRFGVGRPLLREAIRLLAARGLVESRHGQGTRVVADHARPVQGAFAGVLAGQPADAHLLELRLAIETAIAAAAADRHEDGDLAELHNLLDEAAAGASDLARAATLDVAFHARLAQAARNPLFVLVLKPLAGLLEQDRAHGIRAISPAVALADHRRILSAVRAGDASAAAAAMREHLGRVERSRR